MIIDEVKIMNNNFIVKHNNAVDFCVLRGMLSTAITNSCSSVPDSLGDRLFRTYLKFGFVSCMNSSLELWTQVCDVLNEYNKFKTDRINTMCGFNVLKYVPLVIEA